MTLDDGAKVVLLAQDRAGYGNLCQLLSKGRLRCEKGRSEVTRLEISSHADGLLALWGAHVGMRVADSELLATLREAFGDRLYSLAARHLCADDVAREAWLRREASAPGSRSWQRPRCSTHTVHRRRLQDVLTAIRKGLPLHQAGTALAPNAEHALLPPRAFRTRFDDDVAAVARTREVAARCAFSMGALRYRYPSERLPDGTTSAQWLRHLTYEGARPRYAGAIPAAVTAQLDRELALIEKLDYPCYFLTCTRSWSGATPP